MHCSLCVLYFHTHSLCLKKNSSSNCMTTAQRPTGKSPTHRKLSLSSHRDADQRAAKVAFHLRGSGTIDPHQIHCVFALLWAEPCHAWLTFPAWFLMTGGAALPARSSTVHMKRGSRHVSNQNMHTHGLKSQPDGPCWRLQTTHNMVHGARKHYTPAHRHSNSSELGLRFISSSFFFSAPLIATCCFWAMYICVCAYKVKPDCIRLPRARPKKTVPWQHS